MFPSILERYEKLVVESKGKLPQLLKEFQYDTQSLLEAGQHVLVSFPTAQGKSLIQLIGARVMGGNTLPKLFLLESISSFCDIMYKVD